MPNVTQIRSPPTGDHDIQPRPNTIHRRTSEPPDQALPQSPAAQDHLGTDNAAVPTDPAQTKTEEKTRWQKVKEVLDAIATIQGLLVGLAAFVTLAFLIITYVNNRWNDQITFRDKCLDTQVSSVTALLWLRCRVD